jgi:hypothetical protein
VAVLRLSDKIAAEIGVVLRERAQPEDEVLFEANLVHVADEDGTRAMIGVYTTLDCPETDACSISYVLIDPGKYLSCGADLVREVTNEIWDALSCFRMEHATENLDTGTEG